MSSYYRQQLEEYLGTLEVKCNNILDVGGGSYPAPERLKKCEYKEYDILDNGAEDIGKPTYNEDMNYPIKLPRKYDVVFCLELFDYIWNPVIAVKNLHSFLNDNGKLYVTFPFVYSWHNPAEIDYLRYTGVGVEKLLKEAGFKEWKIIPRIDKSGLLESFYKADQMHSVKREPHNITGFIVEAVK